MCLQKFVLQVNRQSLHRHSFHASLWSHTLSLLLTLLQLLKCLKWVCSLLFYLFSHHQNSQDHYLLLHLYVHPLNDNELYNSFLHYQQQLGQLLILMLHLLLLQILLHLLLCHNLLLWWLLALLLLILILSLCSLILLLSHRHLLYLLHHQRDFLHKILSHLGWIFQVLHYSYLQVSMLQGQSL